MEAKDAIRLIYEHDEASAWLTELGGDSATWRAKLTRLNIALFVALTGRAPTDSELAQMVYG